jgi:hypothetical protein
VTGPQQGPAARTFAGTGNRSLTELKIAVRIDSDITDPHSPGRDAQPANPALPGL